MSDLALQDDPTASSEVTTELDLDWLSIEEDEKIRWASTPHKYSIIPALIVGIPLSFVLIGIPLIVASYLQYTNTNYVVTNKGLYSKRGILSRDVQQIGFDKVQNISYSQSAIGSSLGYGSVDVSTAGGSGVELQFRSIPKPAGVQELISKEIDRRQQTGSEGADETDDVLDQILIELRAIRSAVADGEADKTDSSPSPSGVEASPDQSLNGTAEQNNE